jgi:hypothetical protein
MGKKYKSLPRCVVSNKLANGKEVILVDYAVDYVKMMGYVVVSPRQIKNRNMIVASILALVIWIIPKVNGSLI